MDTLSKTMPGRKLYQYIVSRLRRITHAGGRFFVPQRNPHNCGHIHQDIETIKNRLKTHRYLIDDIFEYQEQGQVASAKRFLKGGKQIHIKIFTGQIAGTIDIHAHKEYSYRSHPLKHINREEFENCCEVIKTLFDFCECNKKQL